MNLLLKIAFWVTVSLLAPVWAWAQYAEIDAYALEATSADEANLTHLSTYLIAGASTEEETIRSFYTWLIHHIRYDDGRDFVLGQKSNQHDVEATLRSRMAVCTGFAYLFDALCKKAQIPCEVVSGYSKIRAGVTPLLEQPDHAWNAVLVAGEWQLLDVTWAASIAADPAGYPGRDSDYYFFPSPRQMLLDHLPADPLWQLLEFPINPSQFQQNPTDTSTLSTDQSLRLAYADSLAKQQLLSAAQSQLNTLYRAYKFQPTEANAKHLGHAYMEEYLRWSEVEERLQQTDSIGALLAVQVELLGWASRAQEYIELYDWQKENLAYSYLNHAVGLSRQLNEEDALDNPQEILLQVRENLLQSQSMLQEVPANSFTENGLNRCREYLQLVEDYLKEYR